MRTRSVLVLTLLLATAGAAHAEWVTERLYLGIYPQPDTSTSPLKMLPTGEQVEIVQRQGDFVQLQLDDGTRGWARAEFIAEQPPATVRIEQVTAERDRVQQQLEQARAEAAKVDDLEQRLAGANSVAARLRNQLESARAETAEEAAEATEAVEGRQQRIATLESKLAASEQQVASLQSQIERLQSRVQRSQTTTENMLLKIVWVLASMLVCLIIGAVFGARWMAARVRRRFNGLKVW